MWDILKGKGHVMSKNGKYCCIYYPYHYMGLETPISILLGDLMESELMMSAARFP